MVAIALQLILSIVFGVALVLLAMRTTIMQSDSGRWLLAIGVGCMAACCPIFDILFWYEKAFAILTGAGVMVYVLGQACGPARYNVIRGFAPMLLEARRSMYRMQSQIARAAA